MEQEKMLYNPKNWTFWAFFAGLIPPAIFYYRNSLLLNKASKGKQMLIFAILYFVATGVLVNLLPTYSTVIAIASGVVSIIIASQIAKTQIPAYEAMKKEHNLKGGRNDVPIAFLFLAIWIFFGFVLPYLMTSSAPTIY